MHTVVIDGTPGWQITLILAVTAIFAAGLAVILDRARAARAAADRAGPVTWADGSLWAAPGAAFTVRGGMLDVLDTFETAGAGGTGAASGPGAWVPRGDTPHRDS